MSEETETSEVVKPPTVADRLAELLPEHTAVRGNGLLGKEWTWTTPAGLWQIKTPSMLNIDVRPWELRTPKGVFTIPGNMEHLFETLRYLLIDMGGVSAPVVYEHPGANSCPSCRSHYGHEVISRPGDCHHPFHLAGLYTELHHLSDAILAIPGEPRQGSAVDNAVRLLAELQQARDELSTELTARSEQGDIVAAELRDRLETQVRGRRAERLRWRDLVESLPGGTDAYRNLSLCPDEDQHVWRKNGPEVDGFQDEICVRCGLTRTGSRI